VGSSSDASCSKDVKDESEEETTDDDEDSEDDDEQWNSDEAENDRFSFSVHYYFLFVMKIVCHEVHSKLL